MRRPPLSRTLFTAVNSTEPMRLQFFPDEIDAVGWAFRGAGHAVDDGQRHLHVRLNAEAVDFEVVGVGNGGQQVDVQVVGAAG